MSSPPLSAEQIRNKRLIALGILQAAPISRNDIVANLLNNNNQDEGRKSKQQQQPAMGNKKPPPPVAAAAAKAKKQPVIDLLDSSSDEEEDEDLLTNNYQPLRRRNNNNSPDHDDDSTSKKPPAKKKRKTSSSTSTSLSSFSLPQRQRKQEAEAPTRFHVATWNVWFGPPPGNGDPHPAPRMRALAHELKQYQPYFVGFQEVIPRLTQFLEPALSSNYDFYHQTNGAPYGCAIAVRKEQQNLRVLEQNWVDYRRSSMGRGYLYVRAELLGGTSSSQRQEVLFCTTHLESYINAEMPGASERVEQLRELQQFCQQQMQCHPLLQMAIITGDMNWDDERMRKNAKATDVPMSTILNADHWTDTWLETKKSAKDTCYTYDGKENPMLGNNLRRRFDRCLIRTRGGSKKDQNNDIAVRILGTQLLGTDALLGGELTWLKENPWKGTSKETPTAPSDHFGYLVELELR